MANNVSSFAESGIQVTGNSNCDKAESPRKRSCSHARSAPRQLAAATPTAPWAHKVHYYREMRRDNGIKELANPSSEGMDRTLIPLPTSAKDSSRLNKSSSQPKRSTREIAWTFRVIITTGASIAVWSYLAGFRLGFPRRIILVRRTSSPSSQQIGVSQELGKLSIPVELAMATRGPRSVLLAATPRLSMWQGRNARRASGGSLRATCRISL